MGAGLSLLHGFATDIGGLALQQFLGIQLLAGGIDPLTDQSGGVALSHGGPAGTAGQQKRHTALISLPGTLTTIQGSPHRRDMGRGGAATTADHPHSQFQQTIVVGGHLGRTGRKNGLAVHQLRQTGIGLTDQRQVGHPPHGPQQVVHPLHPQAAVGADQIGAGGGQGDGGRLRRGAQNRTAVILEGQHGDHRQLGRHLLAGHQRRLAFLDIEKGLQRKQVGAGISQGLGLFGKHRHHPVKGKFAHRLHKLPGWPDGGGHVGLVASHLTGDGHRLGIDRHQLVLQSEMFKLATTAAKAVGDDNVGAGSQIRAVHRGHHLGHGQVQLFRRLARLKPSFLQQGAHGTVQNQGALGKCLHKRLHG